KHREATDLLGSDVLCTGHFSKDAHQCLRALTKYLEILTVELQRDVGARARDELVHPHLDGLGEAEDDAWNVLAKRLLHRLDELLSRAVSPGVTRLERYEDVGHLDAHRVHGDLGAPGLADHGLNLRKLAGLARAPSFAVWLR